MRWGDFIIIGMVFLLAAVLTAALAVRERGALLYAEVWQQGALVERVLLEEDTDRIIDLDGHNTIVLKGKTAVMQAADCGDQVCVRTGVLTRAGQAAVCLPNKVVLKLSGESPGVDAVSS
ncbi:MAG: NusG domain II-containing protein [Agathobaculum sp.]|uniref:NusG domain II-containing protein n=1 Tax=Agathobaculum sp. TaxID=2048138 RepID=UPI003D919414